MGKTHKHNYIYHHPLDFWYRLVKRYGRNFIPKLVNFRLTYFRGTRWGFVQYVFHLFTAVCLKTMNNNVQRKYALNV